MNITARRITEAKPITPQSLAQQMLGEAGGDMNKATDKMVNFVKSIPSKGLLDQILAIGARKLLNESVTTERYAAIREHTTTAQPAFVKAPFRMSEAVKRAQKRTRSSGSAAQSALLNMRYTINGVAKSLRDWSGVEVATHGETQLLAGSSAVRNARFLISVGRMAGERKVGEVDASTVDALYAEAQSSEV